jgi:hypothetical protein
MVEQTAQQKADASAAWLAVNRPDLVSQQATTAEAAAAQNAAYMNNTLPVLPKMGQPATGYNQNDTIRIYDTTGLTDPRNQQGVARDVTPTEYYQIYGRTPEQSEAAKYAEFNAPIDFAAYANVPLSQMPANVASRLQDYYAAHPTAKAQELTAQYAATKGGWGAEANPYDPDSAAGIAWEVARVTGGSGNITDPMKQIAASEISGDLAKFGGYAPAADRLQGERMLAGLSTTTGQETVPIRDTSSNAPTYQDTLKYNVWELAALEGVSDRPGYTPITDLGDVTTQNAMKGYAMFSQMLGLQGVSTPSVDTMTARTLEMQRQAAWYTPGTKDEQFFGGEIQKWAENKVELASEYHYIGKEAGVPIPANIFEYAGDLAVEFLKGEPHKASEWFSPVSGEMARELPGGEGLQEYQWRQAIATDKQPGTKIDQTWYSAGINKIISAEGQYGPYSVLAGARTAGSQEASGIDGRLVGSKIIAGEPTYGVADTSAVAADISALPYPYISATTEKVAPTGELFGITIPYVKDIVAFFQPGKEITTQARITAIPSVTTLAGTTVETLPESKVLKGTEVSYDAAGNKITTSTYEVSGGTVTTQDFITTGGKTTTKTTFEKSTPSGWDAWLAGAEKQTADITGLSKLATPTTEQIKEMGKNPLFVSTNPLVGVALQIPQTQEYAASFIRGEAVQVQTKPLESAINYGVAYLGGIAWKGAEVGLGASRASFAEKAISQGGTWRAAEQFTAGILPATGKVLAGAYGFSVYERATAGGTDFSPAAAERLGGITVGEALPGGLGFTRGYATPSAVYERARISEIGYQEALLAGKGERKLSTVTGTPEAAGYKIERITGDYIPEKLPSAEKNALLYGSVMNVKPGITRVVATDIATGEVVGAGAYRIGEISGKPTMVVESIGSVQKGAGSGIVGEMKSIAGREGITSISGEATPSAREFWSKMGAKVSEQPAGRTYPFEITGTKVFDVATGKVAGTLPLGTPVTTRGPLTTSLVPEAGWGVTEPTTTGRFDWYVKQPVTQAVAKPLSALKGDYASFVMQAESITPTVVASRPGMADYLLSKASAGRYAPGGQYGTTLTPEPVTIKATQKYIPTEYGLEPISTEYGSELVRAAYGTKKGGVYTPAPAPEIPSLGRKVTTLKGGVWSTKYIEPTSEQVITGEVAAKAYGEKPAGQSAISRISDVMGFGKDYALPATDLYTPTGERLRVENLNIRSIYGTEPVEMRVSAFMQERVAPRVRDIGTNLFYPEMEIANINRATAVKLGDVFGEAKPAWKSSLNIFGTAQPMRYGVAVERAAAAEKLSTGAAEIKTKTGLSLVTRAEEVAAPRLEQMTGVETGITGMPVWPSGPSPIQKQRYSIEEETQYFTLPPGMVSPARRTETIQTIMQVHEPSAKVSQAQTQRQREVQVQQFITDTVSKQELVSVSKQAEAQQFEYKSVLGISSLVKQDTVSTPTRDVWQNIITTPTQEIITEPITTTAQKQTTQQTQEQIKVPWQDTFTEQIKIPVTLPSWAPSGGGGGGGSKSPWRKSQKEIFYIGPRPIEAAAKQFFRTVGNKKIASAAPSGGVTVTQYMSKRRKK